LAAIAPLETSNAWRLVPGATAMTWSLHNQTVALGRLARSRWPSGGWCAAPTCLTRVCTISATRTRRNSSTKGSTSRSSPNGSGTLRWRSPLASTPHPADDAGGRCSRLRRRAAPGAGRGGLEPGANKRLSALISSSSCSLDTHSDPSGLQSGCRRWPRPAQRRHRAREGGHAGAIVAAQTGWRRPVDLSTWRQREPFLVMQNGRSRNCQHRTHQRTSRRQPDYAFEKRNKVARQNES